MCRRGWVAAIRPLEWNPRRECGAQTSQGVSSVLVLTWAGLMQDYCFSGSVCVFIVQDVLVKHNVTGLHTAERSMHHKSTAPTGLHMQFRKGQFHVACV